ncbi:sensor histidine kinase [Marinicrinis lubricantis]|uniref:Sensor histidine kinase n=1 Tax=Marinicrinis lubricantis TaxID=2086470 RepID=A0ABW1IU19_9BACL
MKRGRTRKYLPFGYKLMLSYCLLIIVPVLLVGYASNSIFVDSITKQIRGNFQGILQQMKNNIGYKMDDAVRLSELIYFDETLASHLRHYEEGWVSYEATTKYLLPKFVSTMEATDRNTWLSIYLHNKSLPEIYNEYGDSDPLKVKSRLFDLYHIDRIQDKGWYQDFPKEEYGKTTLWKQIENDARHGRISMLRRIIDSNEPFQLREVGFMRLSVYLSDLFESLDYQKFGDGTKVFIVDERGKLMASSSQTELPEGTLWTEENAENHLIIRESLPGLGWELIAQIPKSVTGKNTEKVRVLAFLVCLGSFILFSFVGIFISRYFAKRVNKITAVIDSFQEGTFHKRAPVKGSDEFTQISAALNDMAQNIGQLINEVYITNIRKKEAELESLQAQINPHFLYNTLSSINRLAKFGKTDKLQRMVMDLAKFYRLTLNEGRTVIPIRDELEQVKAYLAIQKTKYDERMQVHYDIDPEILQYETIKLILQPFIENVLEHAWCGDRIHIRVCGYMEGQDVCFKVIDDGIGMREELMRQLMEADDSLGYGIRNVKQRIELHYGKGYGVRIFSRPGIGTTVLIRVAARM